MSKSDKKPVKTTVIELLAGPGSGKSTSAAYIFAKLKTKGVNSELVREYTKGWAWEKRQIGPYDQFYLAGKQIRAESFMLGKVDVVVTDSPCWLGAYYAERYAPPTVQRGTETLIRAYYDQSRADGHKHVSVWVQRTKAYNPEGRNETEEQAKDVDVQLRRFVEARGVTLRNVGTDFRYLDNFLDNLRIEGGYLPELTGSFCG